jgi:replication-associated recombination protein RarA
MNIDNRPDKIDAALIRSLREGEDLAPETPAEVEALLEKMKEEGVTIGTTLENAELLAAAVHSRSKVISFPKAAESDLEVELARAARLGKDLIPKEVEERMKIDRERTEREASDGGKGKA